MATKMLVVTNRRLEDESANNDEMFGEKTNDNGPAEVRIAWAEKNKKKWFLTLVKEPSVLTENNLPSVKVFKKFKKLLSEKNKNCVFYVHGYNKSFKESLSQGWKLQQQYGVGVLLFSWASNPGGFYTSEYPKARAIADASSPAIDLTLEKLGRYVRDVANTNCGNTNCGISLNLLTHSLGNFLFQRFVEKPLFAGETRIFDNLILHQADVNNEGHDVWVNKLKYARRVYVTLNENDKILNLSDIINPDRLGNTTTGLNSKRAKYLDFTDADKVGKAHQLFGKPAKGNPIIKNYFSEVFNGKPGEKISGLEFNQSKNAYEVS